MDEPLDVAPLLELPLPPVADEPEPMPLAPVADEPLPLLPEPIAPLPLDPDEPVEPEPVLPEPDEPDEPDPVVPLVEPEPMPPELDEPVLPLVVGSLVDDEPEWPPEVLPDMPDEPELPVVPELVPELVPPDEPDDCATCALSFDAAVVALPANAVVHSASADAARISCGRESLLMCVSKGWGRTTHLGERCAHRRHCAGNRSAQSPRHDSRFAA